MARTSTRVYKKKEFLPGDTVSHKENYKYRGKLFVARVFLDDEFKAFGHTRWVCRLCGYLHEQKNNNHIGSFWGYQLATCRKVLTEKILNWDY